MTELAGSGSRVRDRPDCCSPAAEFDRASVQKGWRYELINGVLVVSPTPSRQERGPNDELGHWLHKLSRVAIPRDGLWMRRCRRRRSRSSRTAGGWIGRSGPAWDVDPEEGEAPTIAVEFVSKGKINQERDYIAKRAEFREIGVREYWVIDRFRRCLTVYRFSGEKDEELLIPEDKTYETPLLPGFVLPLKQLLALADRWAKKRRK